MKRTWHFLIIATIMICMLITGCSNSENNHSEKDANNKVDNKKEIHISAAASLTDVTKDLEQAFNKKHKNAKITFNYGGSGALRQQIEKGAPVDVFMSANTKDIDPLGKQAQNKYEYAQNDLVLIGESNSTYKNVSDLKQGEKLAIGEAKSVPAGKYAEQYLKDHQLYEDVKSHLVFAKDVRQVLNYVEKGNAQLGYVYKTDLYQSQKNGDSNVKEIQTAELKQPITYKSATISDKKLATAWVEFLKTDEAKEILKKYKFKV
ncbi:Molybdate-binding protein ModA [Staphylococcus cohnii subsp. cohnii]|uniref:molybdate ABC transporter substrate-binding protein n=1 Tax=Staphylococcus cohnii TaxID=29382 RepID=UPI001603DDA7|nr:molybdate ABC transporter substrate-binding protein [Staphylococcus cohnii]MBB2507405.1 Molybdate-binding protein ModA [Staphylococcus cohnii subsp. barensis]